MLLLQVTTVFVHFLFFSVTSGLNAGTRFTKRPPSTLYMPLGSPARFQWEFTFGDSIDWGNFEEIVWGITDNNGRLRTKYITIQKRGNLFNPTLHSSVKSRANWTGNISQQQGCQMVFILKNVSKSDQTTYGCRTTVNAEDVSDGPINLVVIEPPTINNGANQTLDVEEGDDVPLHCDANGDPIPLVTWKKDGQILQRSNTTTSIIITNIELRDAGTYVCTAKNRAGSVSQSILVRVIRYRPHFNKSASSNAVVKSWIGQETTIKCAVYANPRANITWFKDGRFISDGVDYTHDLSTLTLTPKTVDDFGLYSCNATNSKGTVWYHITVEQLRSQVPKSTLKTVTSTMVIATNKTESTKAPTTPTTEVRRVASSNQKTTVIILGCLLGVVSVLAISGFMLFCRARKRSMPIDYPITQRGIE